MTRFVIRPPGMMTTPRILAEALGARGTRNGSVFSRGDYSRDFCLYYSPTLGRGPTQCPDELLRFTSLNKRGQRERLLADGIPVPLTRGCLGAVSTTPRGTTYIVRPLRHRGGEGWRLTSDWSDFDPTREYIQELYPKTHEYRIIFCFGVPIITLLKRVNEGTPTDQPWNHAHGSTFITVNDNSNNRLRNTDVVERLIENNVIKAAHLVGVDVMYNRRDNTYTVAEFNFCPAMTIESSIRKVAEHVCQVRL